MLILLSYCDRDCIYYMFYLCPLQICSLETVLKIPSL